MRRLSVTACILGISVAKYWRSVRWPYAPSFVLDVSEIDSRIRNVIDMVFLHDYYEPTLAILYQAHPTWTGYVDLVNDALDTAMT